LRAFCLRFASTAASRVSEVVTVGADEREPAFGCFAFNKSDDAFREAIDDALLAYLGSGEHRAMMKKFGFADAEIDLIAR
jgi:polar amino acid transport system substrate-binding protein